MNMRRHRATPKRGAASGAAGHRFARLMQVDIRHDYYANATSDGLCPDFDASPTPASAKLMNSLGLRFLTEAGGFSVLYDVARTEGLSRYLRQHGVPPDGGVNGHYWTRLSFVLSLNNPAFINFTDIPIDTNPTQSNFYFTNQAAHRSDGALLLTEGERVDGAALLPVEGPEVRVEMPHGVEAVVALDIAGFPALVVPRCVEEAGSPPTQVCRDFVFLDFGTLDEDKYVIEYRNDSADKPLLPRPMLHTTAKPIPLCFIDLLFSKPTPTATGVYPVNLYPEAGEASIKPVRYTLRFGARSTFWRYYIVPQPQREELEDLAIEPLRDTPPIAFAGPTPVRLPTGAPAYRFVSDERLTLQQHSNYAFRLKGRSPRARSFDDVLIRRLPIAASKQVLPKGGLQEPDRNYSDIYVYV